MKKLKRQSLNMFMKNQLPKVPTDRFDVIRHEEWWRSITFSFHVSHMWKNTWVHGKIGQHLNNKKSGIVLLQNYQLKQLKWNRMTGDMRRKITGFLLLAFLTLNFLPNSQDQVISLNQRQKIHTVTQIFCSHDFTMLHTWMFSSAQTYLKLISLPSVKNIQNVSCIVANLF